LRKERDAIYPQPKAYIILGEAFLGKHAGLANASEVGGKLLTCLSPCPSQPSSRGCLVQVGQSTLTRSLLRQRGSVQVRIQHWWSAAAVCALLIEKYYPDFTWLRKGSRKEGVLEHDY